MPVRATLTTVSAVALLADMPLHRSDAARHAQATRTEPLNYRDLGGDRPTVAAPVQPVPDPIVRVTRAPLADGGFDWADGMRLAEWKAAMVRAAPPISSESSSARQTTLGGEPALAWTSTASDGYHVNKLATLHGTRGYMIFLASPTANDDAQNRRTFESIRRSFRFTP